MRTSLTEMMPDLSSSAALILSKHSCGSGGANESECVVSACGGAGRGGAGQRCGISAWAWRVREETR